MSFKEPIDYHQFKYTSYFDYIDYYCKGDWAVELLQIFLKKTLIPSASDLTIDTWDVGLTNPEI